MNRKSNRAHSPDGLVPFLSSLRRLRRAAGDTHRYVVIVRRVVRHAGLVLIGAYLVIPVGCMSFKSAERLDAVLWRVWPPLALTASAMAFQAKNGRWPADYSELRDFSESKLGFPL